KRNLLATLMLSQGVPMLLAGDEVGHSQGGNNNAYAQDNAVTWIDWDRGDKAMVAFVARVVAMRAAHPVLRQKRFLHGRVRGADGMPDVIWRRADGAHPGPGDWHDPAFRCLGVEVRMAAEGPDAADAVLAVFNAGGAVAFSLPSGGWRLILDTTRPDAAAERALPGLVVPAQSVLVFEPDLEGISE
ncbi:MAG: glycogen debranching protein GlgX, partial [Paracoccaceae bacterium]